MVELAKVRQLDQLPQAKKGWNSRLQGTDLGTPGMLLSVESSAGASAAVVALPSVGFASRQVADLSAEVEASVCCLDEQALSAPKLDLFLLRL